MCNCWDDDGDDGSCGCLGDYRCINHRKRPDQPIKPIYTVTYTCEGNQGYVSLRDRDLIAATAKAFILAGFLPVTVKEE